MWFPHISLMLALPVSLLCPQWSGDKGLIPQFPVSTQHLSTAAASHITSLLPSIRVRVSCWTLQDLPQPLWPHSFSASFVDFSYTGLVFPKSVKSTTAFVLAHPSTQNHVFSINHRVFLVPLTSLLKCHPFRGSIQHCRLCFLPLSGFFLLHFLALFSSSALITTRHTLYPTELG